MAVWDEKALMCVDGRTKRKKKPGPKRKPGVERTEPVPGRMRGPGKEAEKKREVLVALKAAGVPDEQALIGAGYNPRSKAVLRSRKVKETVAEMRQRLQETKGFTLEDSAEFYRKISVKTDEETADRLRARTRMDGLLGHDAVKKIEVSETLEISQAVMILSQLPVSPAELARMVEADVESDVESVGKNGPPLVGHLPLPG